MVRVRRRRSRSSRGLFTSILVGQLPAPMRFALESRMHGILTVILLAALVGSGIVSVRWEDDGPTAELDAERARHLGSEAMELWYSGSADDAEESGSSWSAAAWDEQRTELALERWLARVRLAESASTMSDPLATDSMEATGRETDEYRRITRTGPPLNSASSRSTISR